jgi:choline dehydrogenase-like flavoprotein
MVVMSKFEFDTEFDVVVVGAGSAGCVLSARLTENPDITLCAIEAGGQDRNPWIHIPMGFGKVVPDPKINWGYATEPEPGLGGRKIIWPRGKVLGGSGSINGLVSCVATPATTTNGNGLVHKAGVTRTCCLTSSGWNIASTAQMSGAAPADQ